MRRLLIPIVAASLAAPAAAQHGDHPMPAPAPHHASDAAADPHAGHHGPPAPTPDPHAGHAMEAMPGHAPAPPAPPVAPPPAAALSGPSHAADSIYGPAEMGPARRIFRKEHGAITASQVLIDRLETNVRDGRDGYAWDFQAWHGGDIDRLWLKSEGEGAFGRSPERAEVQALWSHAIDPWFNLQAGLRHDFRPDPERTYAVLGIQGLAPYWFEVDGALFLSNKGELTARFEAEYDQRITQKLILQPSVEFDLAAQDVPEIGIGSGLSRAEAGLRLRYQFVPELAPYIGVQYERTFGDTADFHRAAGEDVGGWGLVLGLRAWF